MDTTTSMTALCGLDCGACAAYLATKQGDRTAREQVARDWTARFKQKGYNRPDLTAEDVVCYGCLSDGPIYLYCRDCLVRQCGLAKGQKSCQACDDFDHCDLIQQRLKHHW